MADAAARAGWLAEFDSADAMLAALRTLHARGYTALETYSPYPVPGVSALIRPRRSPLRAMALGAAATGGALSYLIQWYVNAVSYPLNIGGRPAHATTAFIVPTFEGTILLGALGTFFGVLALLKLPRLWRPVFEVEGFERATIDRFWVAVDARDHRAGAEVTPHELTELGAMRVVALEEGE